MQALILCGTEDCEWIYTPEEEKCPSCKQERSDKDKDVVLLSKEEVEDIVSNLKQAAGLLSSLTGNLNLAENLNYGLEWKNIWDINIELFQTILNMLSAFGEHSDQVDMQDMSKRG